MIHLHLLALRALPHGIHQNICSALAGCLCVSVQDRNPQDYALASLARLLELLEHDFFTVKLRLTVEIRRSWRVRGSIGRVAGAAGEDVVRADVDEQNALG